MMCETMSLTVVSIIIEKSLFKGMKMPLIGFEPLTIACNTHVLATTLFSHLLHHVLLTVIVNMI